MHDVAGDEARLIGKQENASVGNGIAFRAITERMNFIEVALDRIRIRLLVRPLAKHRRPYAGRADWRSRECRVWRNRAPWILSAQFIPPLVAV